MTLREVLLGEYLASAGDKKEISFCANAGYRNYHGVKTGLLKRYYLLPKKTKGKKTFYAKGRKGPIRRFLSVTKVWVDV